MARSRDDIEKRHYEEESEKRRTNAQYYTCKKKYYGYEDNIYEYPGKFNACDSQSFLNRWKRTIGLIPSDVKACEDQVYLEFQSCLKK